MPNHKDLWKNSDLFFKKLAEKRKAMPYFDAEQYIREVLEEETRTNTYKSVTIKISDVLIPRPWDCSYCGTRQDKPRCESCGAPKTK